MFNGIKKKMKLHPIFRNAKYVFGEVAKNKDVYIRSMYHTYGYCGGEIIGEGYVFIYSQGSCRVVIHGDYDEPGLEKLNILIDTLANILTRCSYKEIFDTTEWAHSDRRFLNKADTSSYGAIQVIGTKERSIPDGGCLTIIDIGINDCKRVMNINFEIRSKWLLTIKLYTTYKFRSEIKNMLKVLKYLKQGIE